MQYRDQEFQYDSDNEELGTESAREQTSGKQYRQKRSSHTARRKAPKSSTQPGCGIGARRNRRWSW